MASLGYRVPGTIIREQTRPTTTALSSAQRTTAVVAEFNPKIRITGEPVVKSDPLLGTQYINKSAAALGVSNAQITAIAIINGTTWVVGTATEGLRLTTNSGSSFTAITVASTNGGLPSDFITSLYYDSGRLYIGTPSGMAYTPDAGLTFVKYSISTTPALPSNQVNDVFAQGSSIYVATAAGLAISRDGGNSFSVYDSVGSRETVEITFNADTTSTLQEKRWSLFTTAGQEYRVWYNVGGGGTDPGGTGIPVQVNIPAGSNAAQVASATAAAINAIGGNPFLATPNGFALNIQQNTGGEMSTPSLAGDSGFTLTTQTAGANATSGYQEFGLLLPASTNSGLNPNTDYSFVVNGTEYRFTTGAVAPLISDLAGPGPGPTGLLNGAVRLDSSGNPVDIANETLSSSLVSFPTYVATVISEGGGLDDIRITNPVTGASSVVRLSAGTNYADLFQGGQEIQDITAINDTSRSLQGKYIRIFSPSAEHYMWFSVNGNGVDPATLPTTIPALDPTRGKRIDIPAIGSSAWIALNDNGFGNRGKVVSKIIADLTEGTPAFPFKAEAGTTAETFRLVYDLNNDAAATLASTGESVSFPQTGTTAWTSAVPQLPVTFTNASSTITCLNHNLAIGQVVRFNTVTGVSSIVADTVYYVLSTPDADTFTIAADHLSSSPAIVADANGTGTLSLTGVSGLAANYSVTFADNVANVYTTGNWYFTFTLVSATGSPSTEVGFYVYFGADPGPLPGYANGIQVTLAGGETGTAIAGLVRTALTANSTFFANGIAGTNVGATLPISGKSAGEAEVTQNGVGTAITTVTITPGYQGQSILGTTSGRDPRRSGVQFTLTEPYASTGLGGKYFTINSPTNPYGVIYDIESSYKTFTTSDVGGSGRIPLTVNISASDNDATVAQKTSAAISSTLSGQFTVSRTGATMRVTTVAAANVANASAGTSGFTVPSPVKQGGKGLFGYTSRNAPVDGREPIKDVLTVSTLGDVRGLGGSYFLLNSQTNKYVVWYNVNGTNTNEAAAIVAANPGASFVEVDLNGGESDINVANATIAALTSSVIGVFSYLPGGATRGIRTTTYGSVLPDSGDYNTGFVFNVTEQGRNATLAQSNINTVYVFGDDVFAGHASGVNISRNNGSTWTETFTVLGNSLSSNSVNDIYVKSNVVYVATDQGVDVSTNGGLTFTPTDIGPGKTFNENVSKIEVSNNYVFAATDSGLKVSTNSGTSFVERTTADGLTANDIMSLALYKQTLFVGTFNGFNYTLNTDVVQNVANGGVDILAIGSVTGLRNFVLNQDYVYEPNGTITWLPSARNTPAAASTYFVTYNYNRPATDFYKKYAYEDFGSFVDDWQMPTGDHLGNIFVYLAFETIRVSRLIIVPIPPGSSATNYINGIQSLEDTDIQDLVVLSADPEVQVVGQFHVDERSAPENARYRVYWTGPLAGQPLGDKDTPASVIGQKQLLKSERVTFVNTPRGTVSYLLEDGRTGTKVVDGSFIAGALAVYYNAQAGGAPNVEIIGKVIPGIRLFPEDIDEFYTTRRLERAGQESIYLINPVGSLALPVVVDDLTTDSSSLEKQSPNIVRSKDYINRDVAIQIKNSFQGKLMINPGQHIKNINTFMQSLFNQYRGANVIAEIKNISASRSPDRPDTIKIFYAYEAIYTHKYTEGEYYLSIPTG